LVTGAAGFIGFHVARALLDAGSAVIGVDSMNAYYDPRLKEARLAELTGRPGFSFKPLDLADRAQTASLFAASRPKRVIHLAAQAGVRHSLADPHAYVDANIVGFLNVLEGCRHNGVEHLTYASSSSVYGANTATPFSVHHGADHPLSLYGASKRANELMAHCYSHLFALPTTGLRFFTVYGPWGRPDMAMFIFTKAIRNAGRSRSSTKAACAATSPTSTMWSRAWSASATAWHRPTRNGTARAPIPPAAAPPSSSTTSATAGPSK
jgi:UDP-glucuronate 4-epimerase